jgi:predicted O-linked N-acetylglucosamine transferase (SPINDLY family)
MGGVVERMAPGLFELTVVCPNDSRETIRSGVRSPSVGILGFQGRFDQVVRTIRDARFDLLYFWEIGTDPTNYFLPFFRLAPVQCTSWGIQVTSGIPQMDYYLSSALVEPDDAADHYSEGLVLATTLLTWQERLSPPPSPKGREAFGLRPDRHVYLCAQHLGKFHPDFDPLLGAILRQDAEGLVVITEDQFGQAAPRLRSRLARTLPDVADRVVFLPFQGGADYLGLIANADVLLDPLHFGGVNSTYDGFSLNKPIVTLPGQFHRARYTLGCYKKMGISECVASDAQQYVQIAVALGTDAAFRAEVAEKVRRSSPVLFEDLEAVREHQRLFRLLLDGARQAHSPQK